MQLFDLFVEYGAWSWLIVGLVLLGLELMLPGGVFLWLGISAVVTGLVLFIITLIVNVASRLLLWTMTRQRRPSKAAVSTPSQEAAA